MSDPITKAERLELAKLAAKATPRPYVCPGLPEIDAPNADDLHLKRSSITGDPLLAGLCLTVGEANQETYNAEFLAAAANAIERYEEAFKVAERALEAIAKYECRCDGYLGPCGCGKWLSEEAEEALEKLRGEGG